MKQRADKIPPGELLPKWNAIERIVQLYEATERPALAAKWRTELEAVKLKAKEKKK